MIISHARKFIFVKTVKTAGTSLEMALSKYCGPDDVLTPLAGEEEVERRRIADVGAQNYLEPMSSYSKWGRFKAAIRGPWKRRFNEHTPAWQARLKLGEEVWKGYFKFAVVRDPFDRVASRYYYTRKYFDQHKAPEFWDRSSVDQFLRYHPELINENWAYYTEKDRITLDTLVRYERLEEDLGEVSRRIGLGHNIFEDMRTIRAKSDYRPPEATAKVLLNETQRRLIEILCAKEIETFGYGTRAVGEGLS